MGHALLAYSGTTGAAAVNFDLTAATDPDFTQRNGHYTFTEAYRLFGTFVSGATCTRSRFQVPHWNAIGEYNIYPPNLSSTVILSNPQIDWALAMPPQIPLNEEFQMQVTNTGAGEVSFAAIWLITPDWTRNLPAGIQLICVRATAAVAGVAAGWSGPGPITLSQSLRGGVYAVVGAECITALGWFFRIVFPRYRLYQGRKLRPGGLCQAVAGQNVLSRVSEQELWLGEWGRFHTFELPQIETFSSTTGAATQEIRLWLIYLGEDLSLLNAGLGGGGSTI
jgi:hypothetical protein